MCKPSLSYRMAMGHINPLKSNACLKTVVSSKNVWILNVIFWYFWGASPALLFTKCTFQVFSLVFVGLARIFLKNAWRMAEHLPAEGLHDEYLFSNQRNNPVYIMIAIHKPGETTLCILSASGTSSHQRTKTPIWLYRLGTEFAL